MTPIFCFPIPLDTPEVWELFKPFVQRFCDSWRQHPPGCDVELIAVLNNGENTNELLEMFDGLPVTWTRYDGAGADAGCWQFCAKKYPGRFMVACNTRTYFHRRGWLNHIVYFRQEYGPGIYATSASCEGGKLHCCIRTVGIDTDIMNDYPVQIVSRDQGCFFEIGRDNPLGSFGDWVWNRGHARKVVYWSVACNLEHALEPPNIFRRGNQENLCAWDKHTLLWSEAEPSEKERLAQIAFQAEANSGPVPTQ